MANEGYHEPVTELGDETRDMHRAIVSLMEELEAVDWYNQRVDACKEFAITAAASLLFRAPSGTPAANAAAAASVPWRSPPTETRRAPGARVRD